MLLAILSVVSLGLTGGVAVATPVAAVPYPGSQPAWADAANDRGVAVDDSIEGEIFLTLPNRAGAEAFATSVSTPGSANYRAWLTPQQWIAKFSPTPAKYDAVVRFLTSKGLRVTGKPGSRMFVVFRGSAQQFSAVFSTALHRYDYAGRSLIGPSSPPKLPADVAGSVAAISVDQSRALTRPDSVSQEDAVKGAGSRRTAGVAPPVDAPCSNFFGEHVVTVPTAYGTTRFGTTNCGYKPAQLRSAYGLAKLNAAGFAGQGQTIAIVDAYASPTIVRDVNTYSAALGEPALTTYRQIAPKPSEFVDQEACGFPSGWQGEQTLDVEAVHGVAPKANILYVGGFNCQGGIDLSVSKILDGKLANIVSNSYSFIGEAVSADILRGYVNLHLQAAGEGIGMYYSSGDFGDQFASLGFASPDFPASSPFATSVGGTSLGINKTGDIALETGWGSSLDQIAADAVGKPKYVDPLPGFFAFGAGGGRSAVFTQPAYQRGVVPAALARGKRVSPDISALADPFTGFSIGIRPIIDDTTLQTGGFENQTFGGTSLSSPLVAAQMAIVQQVTNQKIGFANPALYLLNRKVPAAFRDTVPQSPRQALVFSSADSGGLFLVSLDTDTSLQTRKGYDEVTGLGRASFSLLSSLATVG
jgi:subtilase family serine protease